MTTSFSCCGFNNMPGELQEAIVSMVEKANEHLIKPDKQWRAISALKYKLGMSNQRLMNYILSTFPDYKDRITGREVSTGKLSVFKKLMTSSEKSTVIKRLDKFKKKRGVK